MMVELGEKNTFSDQVFTTFKAIRIHSFLHNGAFPPQLYYA